MKWTLPAAVVVTVAVRACIVPLSARDAGVTPRVVVEVEGG